MLSFISLLSLPVNSPRGIFNTFNIVSSNEYTEVELRTRLMIAIQSLEFNCPNIIIAVSNDNDVKEHMIQSEKIIEELGYTPVIIGYEPVFEKYKGTGFLTISQKEA